MLEMMEYARLLRKAQVPSGLGPRDITSAANGRAREVKLPGHMCVPLVPPQVPNAGLGATGLLFAS